VPEPEPKPPAVIRASAPETPPKAQAPQIVPGPAAAPPEPVPLPDCNGRVLTIDLPNALRLADASNPTIALARERVREAYARLLQAKTLWLPTLQTGPVYNRHDGQLQRSLGDIARVSKSNFFEGGGAALSVRSSEALYGPLIARRLVQAQIAASRAVTDDVQLDVALTYLDLLRVYGALAINADTLAKVMDMTDSAQAAQEAQTSKTAADINRALTELNLRREERIDLEGQVAAVSARLAQLLLLDPTVDLRPLDAAVLPITLVPEDQVTLDELVATGLMNRPELAESRALVAAALARWRQARLSPLFPRLEAGYSAGTFGGGVNETVADFASRGDGTVQVVWELPGLGAGYVAATRAQRSLYNQANLHGTEVAARVAAEVTAAAKLSLTRRRALDNAQEAIRQAEIMWRKLKDIAYGVVGGKFDPLEPLLAEQALNQARVQDLTQVIEYNKAQFQLYRALGQPPLEALPRAAAIPVRVPVAPGGLGPEKEGVQERKGERK
jgi:outer membrane protein TolC